MKHLTVLGQTVPMRVSPTFLQNAACPLCFKLTYVDHEQKYPHLAAIRGSAAHEAIAALTRAALDNEMDAKDFTDQEIFEAVRLATPHAGMPEIGNVLAWVKTWRDRFQIKHSHIVGHEEKVALDENYQETDWDHASYRGIMDYIEIHHDTHAVVIDYKSQAMILGQGKLTNHMQLTFYCWLAWKMYPQLKTFTVCIWYLQYGFLQETQRTLEEVQAFEQELHLREAKILDMQNWDPIPGEHCNMCDYPHLCPVAEDMSLPPAQIITQDQAASATERLHVLTVVKKRLEEKIKSFVSSNGPVRIGGESGGVVYGFAAKPVTGYDSAKVEEILRANGIALADVANVNKQLLKKLVREYPDLKEQLEDTIWRKTKTEFGVVADEARDDEDTPVETE